MKVLLSVMKAFTPQNAGAVSVIRVCTPLIAGVVLVMKAFTPLTEGALSVMTVCMTMLENTTSVRKESTPLNKDVMSVRTVCTPLHSRPQQCGGQQRENGCWNVD
jgi:hypothetical protein